jgi:L-threonine-O-3-phosphate decarboxylase
MKPSTDCLPRREILEIRPAVHGSLDGEELRSLGMCANDVLDFSANVNPYGPSLLVREALGKVRLDHYPDRACHELRAALAESLGVSPERILPGNGASELILLTALAFAHPSCRVLVLGPTYCEYARAVGIMGASVTTWRAREETGFFPEPAAIAGLLESLRPQLVFMCNPNNPTGAAMSPEVIAAWARQRPQTLFVVDEAYLPFAVGLDSVLNSAGKNVLVLRSMTKDFGLAGLRVGYAVGTEEVIAMLRRVQPPWSVNALAQAAATASLRDLGHRQHTLRQLARARHELAAGITGLGLPPVPSATHFFLVRVGDGGVFRQRLLRCGILVRDCSSFGLPGYVRIAARRPEENERLLAALQERV